MQHSSAALQDPARAEGHEPYREAAREAIALSMPLIENAMREPRYGDSGFLHIVVMDPRIVPRSGAAFERAIMHEHSVGDRSGWDADYAMYARAKAESSWRSGSDNPKGAVWLDGFVVGASGAYEPMDRAYAGCVAQLFRALIGLREAR